MNLPNKLTCIRILMIPVFVALFYLTMIPYHYLLSAIVFALAACTDFLDGYIARKYNLVTDLGKFLDPIADKVLVSTAFIVLLTKPELFTAYEGFGSWIMTVLGIAVSIIMARELIISGFRMVAAGKNLVLAADMLGKYKTTFQDVSLLLLLVSGSFVSTTFGFVLFVIGLVALVVATILTIVSGCNYIIKNPGVLASK